MAEDKQIGFLCKAAASLPLGDDPTKNILKSYYLMRCRDLAKDHGLPDKYFSSKVRCTHCFMEWNKGTETKIQAIKLSRRQRRKIKHYKITNSNKEYVKSRKELLKSNELKQTCSFCSHSTITPLLKPSQPKSNDTSLKHAKENETAKETLIKMSVEKKKAKPIPTKHVEVNVYSKAKDVFSLTNKNNTLPSMVKEQKVIKNNKKKKDKFAGLCQQAVLASAKLKQEKDTLKQNKLNLFLKPST